MSDETTETKPKAARSVKDNHRPEIDLENDIVEAIRRYEAKRKRKYVVGVMISRGGRPVLEVDVMVASV